MSLYLQPPRHAGNTALEGRKLDAATFNPRDTRGILRY